MSDCNGCRERWQDIARLREERDEWMLKVASLSASNQSLRNDWAEREAMLRAEANDWRLERNEWKMRTLEAEQAIPKTWTPIEPQLQAAAASEREAIVAWLRQHQDNGHGVYEKYLGEIADQIAAGEHR